MKIETMLYEEIRSELEEVKKLEVGSEQYKVAVDGLTKLVDRAIEIDKLNTDYEDKVEARELEKKLKLKELEDENKDRLLRNGISIAGILIPVGVTVWGTLKTLKFEETGTVTTIMGRGFINKLLPKK